MKKFILIGSLAVFATACSSAAQQQTNQNAAATTANINSATVSSSHSGSQSSHTTAPANASAPSLTNNSSGAGRNPMERAVDVSKFNEAIASAEKAFKAKSKDEAAKKALAQAFAERAFALTEAAQYRAALGDFRRSLKLDPTNDEARKAQDQILNIFASLNREPPKEGEEPAPLPFEKQS